MINDRYVKLLLSDSRKMIFPLAEFKYVVYDSSENKKVYLGDQTNIISSYGNNGAGVRMVVDWYSGKSRFAYIIK